MSQLILQRLDQIQKAIEALAERVKAIETRHSAEDEPSPIDPGFDPRFNLVKRGPGRPRKDAERA